jgi:hypothetical protein
MVITKHLKTIRSLMIGRPISIQMVNGKFQQIMPHLVHGTMAMGHHASLKQLKK